LITNLIPAGSIDFPSAAIRIRASVSGTRLIQTTIFTDHLPDLNIQRGNVKRGPGRVQPRRRLAVLRQLTDVRQTTLCPESTMKRKPLAPASIPAGEYSDV